MKGVFSISSGLDATEAAMESDPLLITSTEQGRTPEAQRHAVATAINRDGYAVVKISTPTPEQDPLTVLGDALGRRQLHPRGDEFGVIGTVTGNGDQAVNELSAAWRDHVDEYQAVGLKDVGCHTDGAFIEGPGVAPPALLMLHCAQPADTGGESILVDGAALLEAVQRADPALLRELLRPQFTFCRVGYAAQRPALMRDAGHLGHIFDVPEDQEQMARQHVTGFLAVLAHALGEMRPAFQRAAERAHARS